MQERGSTGTGNAARYALIAALVIIAAGAGWVSAQLFSGSAVSSNDRKAIETVVHDYIMDNPEIIPDAIEELQRRENAKQLASVGSDVHAPFPGAVLGNPKGTVTLVEFSDFACGYCRKSVDDIDALIAKNPDLRIVIRELPILSEHSVAAARMALAAAEQGRYGQFHRAMFAAGRPGPDTVDAAARRAGLDMAKAQAAAKSERVQQELDRNLGFARQLGFNGTPSWVAGDQLISGAVGADELAKAIEKVRGG